MRSLQDEILLLRAQIDCLFERFAQTPALAERTVNWANLDAEQAAEQWALLTTGTDFLRDRLQLRDSLPACWLSHGAMVEELSARRSAWVTEQGLALLPEGLPAYEGLTTMREWFECLEQDIPGCFERFQTWRDARMSRSAAPG